MKVRMHVVAQGRVQGVFFRQFTLSRALRLGISGWVRNLPDGTVEALFEGEEEAVQALVDCCRNGPPAARVEELNIRAGSYTGEYDTFTIAY
ncbi:MAG: acylphosphatase [Desulfuromonadaceae bacterium]|nr:acylphosphatase [Desulfuromonadaceae bacterium]